MCSVRDEDLAGIMSDKDFVVIDFPEEALVGAIEEVPKSTAALEFFKVFANDVSAFGGAISEEELVELLAGAVRASEENSVACAAKYFFGSGGCI